MCSFLNMSRLVLFTALLRHLISQVVIFPSRLLFHVWHWYVIVSVWLMLIFMSHSSQVVFKLFVRFCNFFSFARLWSSANNISFKSSGSGFTSFVILFLYTMNSSGDRTHPCLTPRVSWNQSVSPVEVRTELMPLA